MMRAKVVGEETGPNDTELVQILLRALADMRDSPSLAASDNATRNIGQFDMDSLDFAVLLHVGCLHLGVDPAAVSLSHRIGTLFDFARAIEAAKGGPPCW